MWEEGQRTPAPSHRPWAKASCARVGFVLTLSQVGPMQTLFAFGGCLTTSLAVGTSLRWEGGGSPASRGGWGA